MNLSIFKARWVYCWLFFLLVVFFVPQPAPPFPLEAVLSYAFPSNLVASPSGDVVAWVFNQEGKRNIWIARGPEYKAHQLTSYSKDDGQSLEDVQFNFDGTIVVYVRGGSANRAGEYPNPTSNPEGAKQSLWAVNIEQGQPWELGEGNHPLPSPVENRVAYHLKGKIYLASLDNQDPKSRLLFKARGRNSPRSWSPDGSKLAFVSRREDHSFVGIYDFKEKSIEWISPSVDRDVYPVWSPCGKYVAYIRFPGSVSMSYRGGEKFWLMAADVESRKAKVLWECPNKTGGFAQYYPSQPLRWAADGYVVFYSEHEGWMHLYSLSVKERKLVSLTPGEYEVEDSFLSADGKTLVFNSNSGDVDRRHVWSVPVQGGKARLLTPGRGLEWSPVLTSESRDLVFLCSSAFQPASPAVMDDEEEEWRMMAPEAVPPEFPASELVAPQQVIFKAPDGMEVHGQLFIPKGAKPGDSRPAVIFMHGGPIRQMLLGWHMRGYYHRAYAFNQYLANKGYVVLSVNFRSGIGYGYDFRNAPDQGPRGASEYQDIVAAGRYLRSRPEVSPAKIGLWGGSYGGYLTALGLARDSDLFAAGVDLHGVHDWSLRGRRRDGGGWGIRGEDLMSSAYQSSPVADAYFWTSPVLFVHGDDDRNVDFIQTTDMVQRLRELGKTHVELVVIPDEVHGFLLHEVWMEVYTAAASFFDRFLKEEE